MESREELGASLELVWVVLLRSRNGGPAVVDVLVFEVFVFEGLFVMALGNQ